MKMPKDITKIKEKILRKLSDEKEKVYCVFQRFREDNEDIELLEVFDSEEKANKFIEELFLNYNSEHPENTKEENKDFWESDFNTFIEKFEVN